MPNKMTWEEMKKNYPNEWLMITNFEVDPYGHLTGGIVFRHSPQKDDVYAPPKLNEPVAFRYTGESSFLGWRSHVEHSHSF